MNLHLTLYPLRTWSGYLCPLESREFTLKELKVRLKGAK